jgi:hypothetical protein
MIILFFLATVITNLVTAVPLIGHSIAELIISSIK